MSDELTFEEALELTNEILDELFEKAKQLNPAEAEIILQLRDYITIECELKVTELYEKDLLNENTLITSIYEIFAHTTILELLRNNALRNDYIYVYQEIVFYSGLVTDILHYNFPNNYELVFAIYSILHKYYDTTPETLLFGIRHVKEYCINDIEKICLISIYVTKTVTEGCLRYEDIVNWDKVIIDSYLLGQEGNYMYIISHLDLRLMMLLSLRLTYDTAIRCLIVGSYFLNDVLINAYYNLLEDFDRIHRLIAILSRLGLFKKEDVEEVSYWTTKLELFTLRKGRTIPEDTDILLSNVPKRLKEVIEERLKRNPVFATVSVLKMLIFACRTILPELQSLILTLRKSVNIIRILRKRKLRTISRKKSKPKIETRKIIIKYIPLVYFLSEIEMNFNEIVEFLNRIS